METRAYLKGTRLSPQKAALVADQIRGKKVDEAMDFLVFNKQKGSAVIKKLLESAKNAVVSKLPPCHYTFTFNVNDGKLNCHLTQRSGDIALGIPFNLAAYSMLTQIIAKQTNLDLGYFAHTIVDAHIYAADKGSEMEAYDHVEGLKEQISRNPYDLPTLKIADKSIDELQFDDFELVNYQHHPRIKFEVAV